VYNNLVDAGDAPIEYACCFINTIFYFVTLIFLHERGFNMKQTRFIAAAMAGAAALSAFCVTAGAAETPSKTWGATSSGKSFSREWSVSRNLYLRDIEDPVGYMVYGYDTDWWNEDYCKCYFIDHNSRAAVYRSGYGTTEGAMGNPAVWSSCWVRHKTGTISYYAQSYGAW